MRGYLNPAMEGLAKQLTAGLLRLRKGYVDAAEELCAIVRPELEYPPDFVVFRLTGYRPRRPEPAAAIPGRALRADLQTLVFDLCDSFVLAATDYDEPGYDIDALADKFHLSTKTIQRWRRRGLIARRLFFPDGRKRIAFLDRSLRQFVARQRRQVLRSIRFSQLTGEERQDIIGRARRLAARGCSLHQVARRLADRTGRVVETIRYTIRRHDRENPGEAIFAAGQVVVDETARDVIYRCFLNGVSVAALAQRYARTRGSVYRIINEMRARHLLGRKLECVYNPQFDVPDADKLILGEPAPAAGDAPSLSAPAPAVLCPAKDAAPRMADDLPPYLKALYEVPLLSPEEERRLFQQYNYLKHRASQLRRGLDANCVKVAQLRRVEGLLTQAEGIKHRIVRANLRLVVSIARKHAAGSAQSLVELISDGNLTLLQAVEKFDYARGFKFSTYGSWAIIKNFARSVPKERYLLDRFVTGSEVVELVDAMQRYDPRARCIPELRETLQTALAQLSARERAIIVGHFGLDEAAPAQTLDQISRRLGLSKERIRQIEQGAMQKMRGLLQTSG